MIEGDDIYPPDFWPAMYSLVGRVAVHWALLESTIDMSVAMVFSLAQNHGISKKVLQPLTPKVRDLRRCFTEVPALSAYRETAVDLLGRVEGLAGKRNAILHGYITDYDETTGTIGFVKLDAKKTIHEENAQRFTATELRAIGEEVFTLSVDFTKFARELKAVVGH